MRNYTAYLCCILFLSLTILPMAALSSESKSSESELLTLQKAADHGDAEAQFNLGLMYYSGDGVIRDRQKGCELLRASAEQGNRNAIEAYNAFCAK